MGTLRDLKVGDRVDRYHGSGYFMEMEVAAVNDTIITCHAVTKDPNGKEIGLFKGDWTFDRNSGVEEDADLEWGVKFGKTGTYLKLKGE